MQLSRLKAWFSDVQLSFDLQTNIDFGNATISFEFLFPDVQIRASKTFLDLQIARSDIIFGEWGT